jgi:formylglycine-generating enzyme required for sulfatase activity
MSAPAPQNVPAARGQTVGFAILATIACVAAAWLYVQGKQQASHADLPIPISSADVTRFNPDAWFLPNEMLGFVEIPAGSFTMGSDAAVDPMLFESERWSNEHKQGQVDLPAFYIGRYEVTVAQFTAFINATHFASKWASQGPADHPVVNVSWTDALAYARWLEQQLKLSTQTPVVIKAKLNDGWHITLPNEAQWEKAARGSDGRIFSWGNDGRLASDHANFSSGTTTAVGKFACALCAYSLSDMSGNVWELTRSPYRGYPFDANVTMPEHAKALYVMRGGAFNDGINNIRAAVRGGIDPGARRPFIGFRLVLTPN